MPIATIIGAIVAAGATITAGALSARSQRKANETNLELSEQSRQDQLKQLAISNKLSERSTILSEKQAALGARQIAFGEKEAERNRMERNEERGYNRMQHAADKYAEYLNNKNALTTQRLSPLMRSR